MNAYASVVAALENEGCRVAFGVMGDGNMPWLAEAARRGRVRFVHARHEAGAVAMADGHARFSGDVGVCTTTQGPGFTNALTSLTVAARRRSPLLLLTGELPLRRVPDRSGQIYQSVPQAELTRSVGAAYRQLTHPTDVLPGVREAFALARAVNGPVVVGIPVDVMRQRVTDSVFVEQATFGGPPPVVQLLPNKDDLSILGATLQKSRRPVFIAGRGAVLSDAGDAIAGLADAVGATLATTIPALNLFSGKANCVGIAGGYSSDEAREVIRDADTVVLFGSSGSGHTLDWGRLCPAAHVVRVDSCLVEAVGPTVTPNWHIRADPRLVAEGLLSLISPLEQKDLAPAPFHAPARRGEPEPPGMGETTRYSDGGLDPRQTVEVLNSCMPESARFVVGIGHFWWFALTYLTGRRPTSYEFAYDFGCIGQALPVALGAALEDEDRRVVCIEGDVSLMMNIQELETAGRYRIPVFIVVLNDGASAAEAHRMNAEGLPGEIAVFGRPDFAGMARASGVRAARVESMEQLRELVLDWVENPEPTLVDVPITLEVANPILLRYLQDSSAATDEGA